jgi:hypothetical protein
MNPDKLLGSIREGIFSTFLVPFIVINLYG